MITVDWPTKVISIPQSYLTYSSGLVYILDINQFRLDLKALEDDDQGMAWPETHSHNTEYTISGVTYARAFQIINGYTVTFENTGTPYVVSCTGANHNLADVTNFDGGMSLIPNNSAGNIVTGGGASAADIADAVWNEPLADHQTAGSTGEKLKKNLNKSEFLALK